MLRRVLLRASVGVTALTAATFIARRHSDSIIFAQDHSPPRATSPPAAPAAPLPHVDVVSDSETVSAKYVIVGGGVAALHAVKAIRELDPIGKIVVLDASASVPVEKPLLSKDLLWYGHAVDDNNSSADPWAFQHRFVGHAAVNAQVALPTDDPNLSWRFSANVTDMDPDAKAVLVGGSNDNPNSGQVIFFEKCLLATGSSPHRLREYVGGRLVSANDEQPFEPNSPISVLRDSSDYLRLRRVMSQAKHVAVIGGGVPAAELVVGLRRAYPDVRVSMLFNEELVLGALVPSDVAQKATAEVLRHGVDVYPATRVEVLDRSRSEKPVAIFTSNELQPPLEADHVVLAVGEKPATRFAEMAQLELDKSTGGIVVNSELAARSDIYAAGDVACYYDAKLGARTRTTSYDHAAMSGRVAGRNMTGLREVYEHTPMFWAQIGDLRLESVGRIDPKLQTVGVWDAAGRETPNDAGKARGAVYYVDSNRIVGVLLCNVDGQVDSARKIVQRRKLYYDKKILMSLLSIEHGDQQL